MERTGMLSRGEGRGIQKSDSPTHTSQPTPSFHQALRGGVLLTGICPL